MKRLGNAVAIAGLSAIAALQPASAMNFRRLTTVDGQTVIEAEGSIAFGDAAKFKNFLDWLPAGTQPVALSVNSPGGNVGEAADMAAAVQARGLPVAVLGSHMCASACFLLFAAAPARVVGTNALVGVHSASQDGQETMGTLAFTTVMARAAKVLHVPPAIIGKMVTTEPGDMSWLNVPDLKGMGATLLDDEQSRKLLASSAAPESLQSFASPVESARPAYHAAPVPRTSSLEQRAIDFVRQTFLTWSSDDSTANAFVAHAYARTVDFYGKPTRSDVIVAAKQAYTVRWPVRDYRLRAGSSQVACDAGSSTCTVSGIVDWNCKSPQRNAESAGAAAFSVRMDLSTSAGLILAENGSVIERGTRN